MKRMLFVLLTLGLFGVAIVGCRAEGELDVDETAPFHLMQ